MIKEYKQFIQVLNEARQRGTLYHVLSSESLLRSLQCDCIAGHHYPKISLTRSKRLQRYLGSRPTAVWKLILDGDKLTNHYRIKPTQFYTKEITYNQEYLKKPLPEFEEEVQAKKISNLSRYLKGIVLMRHQIDNVLSDNSYNDDPHQSIPWFSHYKNQDAKSTIPGVLKHLMEDYDYPIYVQSESGVIKKDDEYLNFIVNHPVQVINQAVMFYYTTYLKEPDIKKLLPEINFEVNSYEMEGMRVMLPFDERNPILRYPIVLGRTGDIENDFYAYPIDSYKQGALEKESIIATQLQNAPYKEYFETDYDSNYDVNILFLEYNDVKEKDTLGTILLNNIDVKDATKRKINISKTKAA